jgi:Flp pilus assembly protein TadG
MGFSGSLKLWPSMLNFLPSNVRRLAAETRGAEIAEAAAVLPLMFMMLLGIFWFGQAFSIYGAITRAAQEGARAAAAPTCTTCAAGASAAANAVAAVNADLIISKLDPSKIPVLSSSSTPVFNACNGAPTSCQTASGSNVCVQGPVQLSNTTTGTGVCGVSVTFQYPFQFWLPFTSLNKQRVLLIASARVRMETQ